MTHTEMMLFCASSHKLVKVSVVRITVKNRDMESLMVLPKTFRALTFWVTPLSILQP